MCSCNDKSTHLSLVSFLPVIFTRCPRADGLPEGPCSQGRRGPRSGNHVPRSQSRQLSERSPLIWVPSLSASHPSTPAPPPCTSTFTTCTERPHTPPHAHACADVPARPLLTHAATPSLTLGARPREPGLAHDCQHPPHLHTHARRPHSLTLTHTPQSGFSEPSNPQHTTPPSVKLQLHHSPDVRPWASSGPL